MFTYGNFVGIDIIEQDDAFMSYNFLTFIFK